MRKLLLLLLVAGCLALLAGTLSIPGQGVVLQAQKCDPKDPKCTPPKEGCSPGFYKNHEDVWVGICCTDASDPTCGEIRTALNCKGSDASCGRSAAAAFLDACTGCTE